MLKLLNFFGACLFFVGLSLFLTACSAPSTIELVAPSNLRFAEISSVGAFRWNVVDGASGYRVYINDEFTDFTSQTTFFFPFSPNLDYGVHELRVRAIGGGKQSGLSSPIQFRIGAKDFDPTTVAMWFDHDDQQGYVS